MRLIKSGSLSAISIFGVSFAFLVSSFSDTAVNRYFDEESGRHLALDESDPPRVLVQIRFPSGPGYFARWEGTGTREGRIITFTRTLGEQEPRGANFLATASTSRVKIKFAPDQVEPADEGIIGEYRRISEEKRRSLAVKDFKITDEALEKALRNWGPARDPAIVEWKKRWPDLRSRLTALRFPPRSSLAYPPPDSAKTASLEDDPDYWLALVETTGMAISLANLTYEETMPGDGSGDYIDGCGGRVSLRARSDGSSGLGFDWQRGDLEAMGNILVLAIPADNVARDRDGDWIASFAHQDPNLAPGEVAAQFRVQKSGRFLQVDTENVTRYTGKAWIDGMYRWSPVPASE